MHLAATILPIFAVIVMGWVAAASGYLPRDLAAPLMRFAYYVAMPALVFQTIADETARALFDWRFLAAFGGGSMLCFAVMVIFERIVHKARWRHCGMRAAAVSMTNTGFVALPILKALFGQPGVLAAAIATAFIGLVVFPVLVVMLEMDRDLAREHGAGQVRGAALLRQIATNPVILATAAGLAWSIAGIALPSPVSAFFAVLGEALTPCALFAIGLELTFSELRRNLSAYVWLSALKLIAVPLVVYGLCVATDLDRTARIAAVICAAVPTAKSAYVLAVEYDVDKPLVGAVISITTVFSIVSLLAWLYAL